jgi:hypothetical protein
MFSIVFTMNELLTVTKFEFFSKEIWIEYFEYLHEMDIFYSFSGWDPRLNKIIWNLQSDVILREKQLIGYIDSQITDIIKNRSLFLIWHVHKTSISSQFSVQFIYCEFVLTCNYFKKQISQSKVHLFQNMRKGVNKTKRNTSKRHINNPVSFSLTTQCA